MTEQSSHKSGFVNIIGKPNAGKSTLLNALLGEKLAIVTQKVQTTRHRIFGIVNQPEYQIVFSDTPGVLEPKYELQEKMMDFVKESFKDADIIIFITEIGDEKKPSEYIIEKLKKTTIPFFILINKIDISDQKRVEKSVAFWHEIFPEAEILPVSAMHKVNTEYIIPKIVSMLPIAPPYFDKDAITDKPERFFVNEIIREKILLNYEKEIPYSVEIVTESFKELEDILKIESLIYVERDSQKGIIIGHKGNALRNVAIESMKELEKFFAKKIDLHLFVKVKKDWRKNAKELKKFGY